MYQRNSTHRSNHAFAGLVSMLPTVDNSCFAVRGGNNLLPQRLLELAGAHVKSGWVVDKVMPARHATFELHAHRHGKPPRQDADVDEDAGGEHGDAGTGDQGIHWDQVPHPPSAVLAWHV